MDDASPKKRKSLTPRQRFKNLMDGLAEDALNDPTPLTPEEAAEAERVKKELLEKAEASNWQQSESNRKARPKKSYLN
jgi:hypothetical protein